VPGAGIGEKGMGIMGVFFMNSLLRRTSAGMVLFLLGAGAAGCSGGHKHGVSPVVVGTRAVQIDKKENEGPEVVVRIAPDGRLFLSGECLGKEEVYRQLRMIINSHPDARAIILNSHQAQKYVVVETIELAKIAGFRQISLTPSGD
jgi:hypothetical protein